MTELLGTRSSIQDVALVFQLPDLQNSALLPRLVPNQWLLNLSVIITHIFVSVCHKGKKRQFITSLKERVSLHDFKNHFNPFNNNQYIQNGYHRQIINYTADNF